MHRRVAAAVVSGGALLLSGCGGGGDGGGDGGGGDEAYLVCDGIFQGTPKEDKAEVPTADVYNKALEGLTEAKMDEIKKEMVELLKDEKKCWPFDSKMGTYAGLMARLTWHCSGSYRELDGIGGCMGGRQRFEPERSWEDNTNLDKARALLHPLKEKYGDMLSWGDLMVLAGTTAYRESGATVTRMCFGRMDEADGTDSKLLGPTKEQEDSLYKCPTQGKCPDPYPTTIGLIYVNPGGPEGGKAVPNPTASVAEIRRTFKTMGHSDRATVALIGGGHALGKVHGNCDKEHGAGKPPLEAFPGDENIWQGKCGSGKGDDTTTSGFEGYWSSTPAKFSNEFFKDLKDKEWENYKNKAGNYQWRMKDAPNSGIMRLTTDMALLEDPEYKALVEEYAESQDNLTKDFDEAWDLLTTRGKGTWSPNSKCDDGSKPEPSSTHMRSDDATFAKTLV